MLVYVVQHHNRGNKINRLTGGKQVEIGSTVTAPVTIANFWLRTKQSLGVDEGKMLNGNLDFQRSDQFKKRFKLAYIQFIFHNIFKLVLVLRDYPMSTCVAKFTM